MTGCELAAATCFKERFANVKSDDFTIALFASA
jgi:hypothetical protein